MPVTSTKLENEKITTIAKNFPGMASNLRNERCGMMGKEDS
jgi:hypothetical protein